jgi:hypothetical protein
LCFAAYARRATFQEYTSQAFQLAFGSSSRAVRRLGPASIACDQECHQRTIQAVVLNGRLFKRAGLDAMLEKGQVLASRDHGGLAEK